MKDGQTFVYRGVRIRIEPEVSGTRIWAIFPEGQPELRGCYRRTRGIGSFRGAFAEAEAAIDVFIKTKRLDGVRLFEDP